MYPVFNPRAQLLGPLAHCLRRTTNQAGSRAGSPPEEGEGCSFIHATLKHASDDAASIVYDGPCKVTGMDYGARLVMALALADESRDALAKALGVSVQAISQVITGTTRAMTAENTLKAARFLGVNPYWLATGEETPRDAQALRQLLSDEAVHWGVVFDQMNGSEKEQFRLLIAVAIEGRKHLGGMSNFSDLGS